MQSAITSAQLSPGAYPVTVDATDAGGDVDSGVSAGNLAFVYDPLLSFNLSNLYVDYDHRGIDFYGQLTGLTPGGTTYFAAKLAPLGQLVASGCLTVTVPNFPGPQTSIQIQYSGSRKRPWLGLGKLALHNINGAAP